MASTKTLTPSDAPSLQFQRRMYDRSFEQNACALEGQCLTADSEIPGLFSVPAILAGLFGVGLLQVAHADANEAHPKAPLPSESPSNHVDLEQAAKKERQRLEGLLKSKGMQYGSILGLLLLLRAKRSQSNSKFLRPVKFRS